KGGDHSGIMVLPDGLEPGTPLDDVLPIGDDILDVETLYNRPDLTSIYGIAREVAVLTGGELGPVPGTEPERAGDGRVELVIADAERPIAIAGVMGGANTEVGESTKNVLLEAANFEQLTVLRSGERHRMRTESQTRWEKGVDPEQAEAAARYASQLFVELAGARLTGAAEVRADPVPPPAIAYRPASANATLGRET